MSDLIEHILNEDYVSASRVFESKIDNIIESKLYEMKKMVQAEAIGLHGQHYMSNADWAKYRKKKGPNLGPLDTPTKKGGKRSETGLEQRKRLGFVKASKVLPDPRDRNLDEMIGLPIIPPEKESEYQKKAKKSQEKAASGQSGSETPRSADAMKKSSDKSKTNPNINAYDYMTKAGREKQKAARRQAVLDAMSDPKKKERLQSRLDTAKRYAINQKIKNTATKFGKAIPGLVGRTLGTDISG